MQGMRSQRNQRRKVEADPEVATRAHPAEEEVLVMKEVTIVRNIIVKAGIFENSISDILYNFSDAETKAGVAVETDTTALIETGEDMKNGEVVAEAGVARDHKLVHDTMMIYMMIMINRKVMRTGGDEITDRECADDHFISKFAFMIVSENDPLVQS